MKTLLLLYLLFCSYTLSAQEVDKADYIGIFSNNEIGGDTISGYVYISLDSFKTIYTISIKDGNDFLFPIGTGVWVVKGNAIEFKYNNGDIKRGSVGSGHFTSGDLVGAIPMIYIEDKHYSNLSHSVRSAIQ